MFRLLLVCLITGISSHSLAEFVPAKYVWTFTVDWSKAEKKWAEKGKPLHETQVMMCDDSYFSLAEIEFEGYLGHDTTLTTDCEEDDRTQYDETNWIRYSSPSNGSCKITLEKFGNQKQKEAEVEIELHDAC